MKRPLVFEGVLMGKKISIMLFICLLTGAVSGCGTEVSAPSNSVAVSKSLVTNNDFTESESTVDSEENYSTETVDGVENEDFGHDEDREIGYNEQSYDEFGNCIEIRCYDVDGNTNGYTQYEYNTSNNLILETDYDAEGNVIWWYGYDYDEAGNLIEEISLSIRIEYEYDEFGNKVKEIMYDGSGDFISQTEWTYE